jgi:macrolide-specific efflux system membrane fusion protein
VRRLLGRRLLLAAALVVVLAGAGAFAYTRVASGDTVSYRTAVAQLGTVTQTVSLSGNLTPTQETDLDFASSGRVTAVDVQPGQMVTQGQTLATLDPTLLNAQLAQAQANLTSAQAKLSLDEGGSAVSAGQAALANARTNLSDTIAADNLKVSQAQSAESSAQAAYAADGCAANAGAAGCSGPSGAIAALQSAQDALQSAQLSAQQAQDQAQAQVTTAQSQLTTAEAQQPALVQQDQAAVESDQVTVEEDQAAVTGATLVAPSSGEVAEVNVTVGELVTGSVGSTSGSGGSGGSGSPSPAIMLIVPGEFSVTGSVSDAQVDEIALGQSAYVTPAGSTQAYTGTVTEVAPVATISSGVATFPVTVTLDGNHPELRSGMSASVSVTVNRQVGVLVVPTSSVSSTGGTSTVQLMVKGTPRTIPVTVGASDPQVTQILSGLSPGDVVVIAQVTGSIPSSGTGSGRGLLGGGRFAGGGAGPVFSGGG